MFTDRERLVRGPDSRAAGPGGTCPALGKDICAVDSGIGATLKAKSQQDFWREIGSSHREKPLYKAQRALARRRRENHTDARSPGRSWSAQGHRNVLPIS